MEESTPTDGATVDVPSVTSSAMTDHEAASKAYLSARQDTETEAGESLAAAAAALASVTDAIVGDTANRLDRIDGSVIKYLSKIIDAATADHASAVNRLFSVGARPLYVTEEMIADMERGDPALSAVEQILSPIADQSGPTNNLIPEPSPGTWADLPGYPPGIAPPVSPPPTLQPPSVTQPPVSPPIGGYEPGTCPPPEIVLPPCPAPTVIVVPSPWQGPPIPPTPVVPPPDVPEPPTEPPTEPVPPGPTPPETAPPPVEVIVPPETAPPPRPVSPPRPRWPSPLPARTIPRIGTTRDWSSADRCHTIAEDLSRPIIPPAPSGTDDGILGLLGRGLDNALGPGIQAAIESLGFTAPITFRGFRDAAKEVEDYARTVTEIVSGDSGLCSMNSSVAIAAAGLAEQYTKMPAMYLAQAYVYDLQYCRPQYLPSQEQVDTMYVRGVVDTNLWQCLTRANGNHLWAREHVISAARSIPSVGDLITLRRRNEITANDYTAYMRAHGYMSGIEAEMVLSAADFIPPYSDLTRFMVRDSADFGVVLKYQYDEGFERKFVGPIREWAQAQGITEDVMRYIWRAHWQIPSPTQLYEMLHRLRPGRVAPGVVTKREDVIEALQINDMAPGFVDRMIETSYNVITRTDILTFYTNGSMEKPEVVERLQDTGYNEADARRIADAWELEVSNRRSNKSRVWSRTNIVRMYRDGAIDREQAKKLLRRTIATDREADDILDDMDAMRRAMTRAKCIKATRKRRIMGELSEVESRIELGKLGVDLVVANTLAEGWTCEITSMQREPTVKMLTDWFLHGIIDVSELDKRLRNLRFTPKDAENIIKEVVAEWNERMERQAAAAARRAAAEEVRRRKEAERLAEKRKKRLACLRSGKPPDEC